MRYDPRDIEILGMYSSIDTERWEAEGNFHIRNCLYIPPYRHICANGSGTWEPPLNNWGEYWDEYRVARIKFKPKRRIQGSTKLKITLSQGSVSYRVSMGELDIDLSRLPTNRIRHDRPHDEEPHGSLK
jgi:hypothetical protein